MDPYPLKFEPIYKERIWGGQQLREKFGKDIPPHKHIGESWEIADLPDDKSVIANGALAGRTLGEAISEFPEAIMGDANFSGAFPLLVKILDAQDVLSVQVHPDPAACERMGQGEPKTECWYIIEAEPGAVIYKGLQPGTTRQAFAEGIRNGSVAELLVRVPVAEGECHFLPAGTPHSIGGGLLIAEVQTPSDTTYRVFDWNRVDASGQGRQLHIEEALESIHFDAPPDGLSVTTVGRLVECPYFKIDKGHQAARCERLLAAGSPKVLMMVSGRATAEDSRDRITPLEAGETVLMPAAYEGALTFETESEYLIITI